MTYARKMAEKACRDTGNTQPTKATVRAVEAVIREVIEACAQEAFSFNINWAVGFSENLGQVGLRIRSMATEDEP